MNNYSDNESDEDTSHDNDLCEECLKNWRIDSHSRSLHSTQVDIEIEQIDDTTFEIYEVRKCSQGHFFRRFIKIHNISDETIRNIYGRG